MAEAGGLGGSWKPPSESPLSSQVLRASLRKHRATSVPVFMNVECSYSKAESMDWEGTIQRSGASPKFWRPF